jgi:hypothetical protein
MKKLSAKTGEYQKDGATKGRYTNIGVIQQSNDGGEYVLLDPTVSLAGILAAQNALAVSQGKEIRDRVMVGVFEDQQGGYQQQQPQQQQGYQQAPQQQYQQQPAQQYQQPQNMPPQGVHNPNNSDVPF